MCHKLHYSVLLFAFCAAWSSTIQAQLVGLWTFEEGAGDRVVDRSGNGHDGTIVDARYQAGGFDGSGFAMAFSGQVASRVSVGSFDVEGSGITLAGWLKASNLDTPGQDPRMISKATAGAADAHIFLLSSARSSGIKVVRFRLRTDNGQATTTLLANTTTGTLLVDEWIHAAATWDGATMRVFKNGQEVGSTARDGGAVFADGSVGVALGNQPNGAEDRPFEGLLDDLVILSEALTEEGILEIMEGFASPALAANPSPAHNGNDVPRDTVLTWTSGEFANTHTVYLGASFDDVNDASAANPGDVLLGEGLTDASVDSGRLQFDQTYYWRVDEVNGAPDFTVLKGDVWSFTVEREAIPISDVTVTASSEFGASVAANTINGSGLVDDLHGASAADMWISGGIPATLEYAFDRAYKLQELWIWNSNQLIEPFVGFGAKDVVIEHSLDTENWTVLEGVGPLAQAPGADGYAHNNTINFSGAFARHVRVTINSVQGIAPQASLSEVRFHFIPVNAREPDPADGGSVESVNTALGWRSGREAVSHEVTLDPDRAAVADGSAGAVVTAQNGYTPDPLNYSETYYWQVVEINDAATPARHAGDIWRFTTPEYLLVDDFESYADDEFLEIWATWVDGFEDDTNGSLVGNGITGSPETTIVNGDKQSLPLHFDNSTIGMSEATRTFDAAQDWSTSGIQTLGLWFHGASGNSGQLYVKINGVKVLYDGDAGNIALGVWQPWNIDLAASGVNVQAVGSLAIGIEGNGGGVLYVDDIRLYASSRQLVSPVDPGAAGLVAHYPLDQNTNDSSGNGHNGSIEGAARFVSPGQDGTGSAMQFGLDDDRITVESFDVAGSGITLAAWINPISFRNDARMISKSEGGGTNFHYWAMVLSGTGENFLQFRLRTDVGNTTSRTSGGNALVADEWTHVAVTWDAGDPVMRQYKNGQEIDSLDKAGSAVALGPGVKIGMGNQSISALAQGPGNEIRPYDGLMDEIRVYERGLSPLEIIWLTGRTQPFDKPF